VFSWQSFRGARYVSSVLERRAWRDQNSDSRTNIIVTKAKLQGLAIMGSDVFFQSESIEARPVQPDHSIYGRPLFYKSLLIPGGDLNARY